MRPELAVDPPQHTKSGHLRTPATTSVPAVPSLVFTVLVLGAAHYRGEGRFAVYALSFWHYYLYGLAYCSGAVSLRYFKRHAIMMKSVSVVVLGYVYFAAPIQPASLLVMAVGFVLNSVAACVLGSDRTYYGYELGALPPLRITAFPYSYISHPMLVGNMTAFAGTLLNAEFRQKWWPLAIIHVALNGGLLLMELYVPPRRNAVAGLVVRRWGAPLHPPTIIALVLAAVAVLNLWAAPTEAMLPKLGMGACAILYSYVLYRCYAPRKPDPHQSDDCRQKGIP